MLSPRDVADMEPHFLLMTAEAWEKLANAVRQKESEYRAKVLGPLDGGAWTGDDATKALTMLRYFADDLQAVQAEAGAGAGILREAHGQLLAAKNTMKALYDEAYRDGLTVNPDGTVSWGASETENVAAHKQALGHDLATRIATVCQQATDADLLADRMLRDNTDNGPDQDFNRFAVGADPAGDAIRVRDLLQNVEKLSPDQLREVRLLMEQNVNDPAWSEQVVRSLGPKGLIDESGRIAQLFAVDSAAGKGPQLDDLKRVQALLGTTLAAASPRLAADKPWMAELKAAAETGIQVGREDGYPGRPIMFGYQPLGVLLSNGTYDKEFLKTMGTNMREFEERMGKPSVWESTLIPRPNFALDLNGKTQGWDPGEGLMTALSHNPQAATEFLDPDRSDNLRYYTEKRPWLPGYEGSPTPPKAAVGLAVEAATSGHVPNGQPHVPTDTPPAHTPEQERIMRETVKVLGDPAHLDGKVPPELRQSMANVISDYIQPVNKDLGGARQSGSEYDRALLNTIQGVAHNPEAFATITSAQIMETDRVMKLPESQPAFSTSPDGRSKVWDLPDPVKESIAVNGMMAGARDQAIKSQAAGDVDAAVWETRYKTHLFSAVANRIVPVVPGESVRVIDIWQQGELDQAKSDINSKAANQQFEAYWTTRGPVDRVVTDYAARNGAAYDDINTTVNDAFEYGVQSPVLRNP